MSGAPKNTYFVPRSPLLIRVFDAIARRQFQNLGIARTILVGKSAILAKQVEELERRVETLKVEADGLRHILTRVRVPPILVTTMPKSGTYFISKTLSQGLQVDERIIANQYFPYDRIRFTELKKLYDLGGVSQDHFDAHPYNLTLLGHYFDRIVVQIRDPRQAVLSWVRFLEEFDISEETFKFVYPVLPRGFFAAPLHYRLDWAIETWLPLLVEWVQGWIDAQAQSPLKIKITRFEDMIRNEKEFFDDLLDFFAIPRDRFMRQAIPRDSTTHFRKGKAEEWREVFTPEQKIRANRQLSIDLAARFEWLLT